MSAIFLKSDSPHSHVHVPNEFIDYYMKDANGEFVKVYLFLLRCMEQQDASACSVSAMADYFDSTEKDILRALKYWEKAGVLTLTFDDAKELTELCFCDLNREKTSSDSDTKEEETVITAKPSIEPVQKSEYTLDEMKHFCSQNEVSELFFIIETYLKHPLSSFEMNMIIYWYDKLHFSPEVIEYLVEYCITNGHASLRYMDKVALAWSENKIDTIEKAKEHVAIRSKTYYGIMKAFGITGRNLADSETAFVTKWTKEFVFELPLIQEACRRTISATQKPSFEYADKILTNWYKHNVRTLQDITALDEMFNKTQKPSNIPNNNTTKRNKFNNFHQRTYDNDEYEKLLLTTSI